MSIFSPRNFISPLTNTVNLVAIILVILLFAVFRFSMGRMNSETKALMRKQADTPAVSLPVESAPQTAASAAVPATEPAAAQAAKVPGGSSDLKSEIEALSKGGAAAGGSKNTSAGSGSTGGKANDGSLGDVEKALGLR